MEKLYSAKEAAAALKISLRTFKSRLIANKIIPVKVGANGTKFYSHAQLFGISSSGVQNFDSGVQNSGVQIDSGVQSGVQNSDVQIANSGVQIHSGVQNSTSAMQEKNKTALEAATNSQNNINTHNNESQKNFDFDTQIKRNKKHDNYDEWIRRRRELAEQAKQYLPNLLYELGVTNLNKNFSCSIFNPHHADHTPSVTYYADTQTVHCHACGFHGNIFQVYATAYNKSIDKALFDEVFAKYGLIDYTSSNIKLPTRPKITPVAPPKDAKKEIIDRSDDIIAAIANINLTDYWAKRGFSSDTVHHFRMGYIQGWKHPDFNNTPPSDRLILPTGDGIHSYLARDVHSDGNYKVMKVGGKVLFNLDGFNFDSIIVNEGEFDAISTYQVGFYNVVGLGGVGNKDKFVDSIAKLSNKPKFIIIALDNDKSGFDAANWIHEQLDKLHIYSLIINNNFGDFKDANALLQHDSNALKSIYENAIHQANSKYENYQFPVNEDFEDDFDSDNEDFEDSTFLQLSKELLEELMFLPLSDAGNAERLIQAYGQKFVYYLTDSGRWLNFNGCQWLKAADSTNSSVTSLVINMARQLRKFANKKQVEYQAELDSYTISKNPDGSGTVVSIDALEGNIRKKAEIVYKKLQAAKGVAAFMKGLEKRTDIDNSIYLAKGYNRIRITNDDLNRHPMLLNTPTGVIDLETGKLLQHDSNLLMTQCTNAIYVPNYHNDFLEQTIKQILPDEETRESFMRFLGYAITASIREEKAAFLNGAGRNGKGSLMKLLSKVLGSYAISIPIDLLLMASYFKDGNAPSPELAKLEFIRVAFSDEIPPNRRLDIAKFKLLTGGDPLAIRELRRDPRMINEPMFKLILSGNHLPAIDDANDVAFKERTLIYPFTQQFIGDKCNPHLKEQLLTNDMMCAFLSMLVDSCIEYQKYGLIISSAMKEASKEYLANNDAIGNFIDEHCVRGSVSDFSIPRSELINRIRHEVGSISHMTDNVIIDSIKRINGLAYRRSGSDGSYKILGIKWRDANPTLDIPPLPTDADFSD